MRRTPGRQKVSNGGTRGFMYMVELRSAVSCRASSRGSFRGSPSVKPNPVTPITYKKNLATADVAS